MTIASVDNSRLYAGDGVSRTFPLPIPFQSAQDLLVIKRLANCSEQTLVLGADYSVAGAGLPAGGNITLEVAPLGTERIAIVRDPPLRKGAADRFQKWCPLLGQMLQSWFRAMIDDDPPNRERRRKNGIVPRRRTLPQRVLGPDQEMPNASPGQGWSIISICDVLCANRDILPHASEHRRDACASTGDNGLAAQGVKRAIAEAWLIRRHHSAKSPWRWWVEPAALQE